MRVYSQAALTTWQRCNVKLVRATHPGIQGLQVLHANDLYVAVDDHVYLQDVARSSKTHLISLTLPESITKATSSIVMEVSATLVATTILRWPAGTLANTRTCKATSHC